MRSEKKDVQQIQKSIDFGEGIQSAFDESCAECFAQYANENETPIKPWDKVKTKLNDIDTSKLHYVKIPENHIVIDFDIKDESGKKSFEKVHLEESLPYATTYPLHTLAQVFP